MPPVELPMDQAACTSIVCQYLAGQGWNLVDPLEFAGFVWQELADSRAAAPITKKAVETRAWLDYSVVLYNGCREMEGEFYEQAWRELSEWLNRRASHLNVHEDDREALAQETIADLIARLPGTKLEPRAFLAFALQCLKNKNISLIRRANAAKRPDKNMLSLEALDSTSSTGETPQWEDKIGNPQDAPEQPETHMEKIDTRQRLERIFRTHLGSELQIQVAEAYFLDGLPLAEIARTMGRHPHEIRQVKARAVQRLRNLPPDELRILLDLLGGSPHSGGEAAQ